jgi:glycosyltransferase involved in cell wall biosynthesis
MNGALPLVSILIPAYRQRFFSEALESALAQTWPALEIVVSDDSAQDGIERAVRARADPRVRYERNRERLGFARNFSRCLTLARGEYAKFLNDDDRLRPRCVEAMARILHGNPGVRLATSRRAVIDDGGRIRADIPATMPVSHVPALVFGRALGDLVLVNGINFIGEPSTVMFRRADAVAEDGLVFRWGGHDFHCMADVSLWLRLLGQGLAYYDAEVLSEFRIHGGQEQRQHGMTVACVRERYDLCLLARHAGFLASAGDWRRALEHVVARSLDAELDPLCDEAARAQLATLRDEVKAEIALAGLATP